MGSVSFACANKIIDTRAKLWYTIYDKNACDERK